MKNIPQCCLLYFDAIRIFFYCQIHFNPLSYHKTNGYQTTQADTDRTSNTLSLRLSLYGRRFDPPTDRAVADFAERDKPVSVRVVDNASSMHGLWESWPKCPRYRALISWMGFQGNHGELASWYAECISFVYYALHSTGYS